MKNKTQIRPFKQTDLPKCLGIFKSNTPKYFHPDEVDDFSGFLKGDQSVHFFVFERTGKILACGGIYSSPQDKEAGLAWGMVHSKFQGLGIGKELTIFRMEYLLRHFPQFKWLVRTSQFTKGFYSKFDFQEKDCIKNGWGFGFDKIIMVHPTNQIKNALDILAKKNPDEENTPPGIFLKLFIII